MPSYTIADVFLDALKGLLSCFKFKKPIATSVADPDPDPDPDPPDPHSTCFWASGSGFFYHNEKIVLKNLDSFYFVTLFDFLSLKNDVNVA